MPDLSMGSRPDVNFERLDEELRAALPGQLDGISQDKLFNLTVHVKEGLSAEALRQPVLAVLAAHNPAVLSAAQAARAAENAARYELAAADFIAWRNAFNAATTLAEIKPLVRQLARVVWMVAKAQGLTTEDDPGA